MDANGNPMPITGNPILDNPTLKATLAAQMAQQNAPPPPAITMPAGGAAASPSILSGMPSMPSTPQPAVGAPRGTVAGDTNELGRKLSAGSGISQIHSKIEDSGFGQKHPVLSKVLGIGAQGLAELGDIGLRTVAPAVDLAIPGTSLHHLADVRGDQRQVAGDVANQEKGAQAANLNADVPLRAAQTQGAQATAAAEPQKAEDTHALTQSEIAERNAQAANLLHPQAKTDFEAWQQQNPGRPIEDWLKEQAANKNVKPDTPEQQYLDEYAKTHPGSSVADAERQYTLDTQRPPQIAPVMMFAPNPDGGSTAVAVHPGQTIAPGTQTAAGVNTASTPTMTVRTAAARAKIVNESIPGVLDDIEKNKAQMGPILGRWNDFMQGKVGTDNPDFAALRMDLTLMATAVALAHAQGRLPENLREEFDRAINAPQQSPENLEAAIKAVQPWMQKMQDAAERPGAGGTSGKGIFNSAAWAKANPKGDVAAAKAYAKSQGYEVK